MLDIRTQSLRPYTDRTREIDHSDAPQDDLNSPSLFLGRVYENPGDGLALYPANLPLGELIAPMPTAVDLELLPWVMMARRFAWLHASLKVGLKRFALLQMHGATGAGTTPKRYPPAAQPSVASNFRLNFSSAFWDSGDATAWAFTLLSAGAAAGATFASAHAAGAAC
jgi:hypothetical protein